MTHTTTSLAMGLNAEYEYHHVVHRMITDGFLFFLKVIFTVCMSNVCHAGSSRDAPATSQYFSQRAIVSLHNSTFSKQHWHLKKKKKKKKMANCCIYISRSAKVLLQCFCCSLAHSEPPHEVHARPSVRSCLVEVEVGTELPTTWSVKSRHTCLLTTLCTGAIPSLSIHRAVWRQLCLACDSVSHGGQV